MHVPYRLRTAPPELLEKARRAAPPPKLPRGFFDSLMAPTKLLLDNGLRLAQAADWLITERALKTNHRTHYLDAMHARFTRFRAREAEKGEEFRWRTGLGYDRAHAVGRGTIALCGARAGAWMGATDTTLHCKQCVGIIRTRILTIHREN